MSLNVNINPLNFREMRLREPQGARQFGEAIDAWKRGAARRRAERIEDEDRSRAEEERQRKQALDNERANAAAADERVKAAMDIYGQGSEKADQAFADLIAGLVGNRQAQTQTEMDAVSGKTDLGMNQEKGVGGAFSTIFKSIFG